MKRTSVFEDQAASSIKRCYLEDEDTDLLPPNNLTQEITDKLPVELKLHIIEYLGSDVYYLVTGDEGRADTLLLQERNFKQYFDTRSADYCLEKDVKLARFFKNCTAAQLTRLPMLADRQFLTYLMTQPKGYVINNDTLLKTYFNKIDISRLTMLAYGEFNFYKKSQPEEYDNSDDLLLMAFLGTNADKATRGLEFLIDFDKQIERVHATNLTGGKLFFLNSLNTLTLNEKFFKLNVTVPECYQPLYLRKILANYTESIDGEHLEVQGECVNCGETSISASTAMPLVDFLCWFNLRVIVFCSNCASCLLRIPM